MALFLVCDDAEMKWGLIDAISIEEAVSIARNHGQDPYYVVDEKVITKVWHEEEIKKKQMNQEIPPSHLVSKWKVKTVWADDQNHGGFFSVHYIGMLHTVLAQIAKRMGEMESVAFIHGLIIERQEK